MPEPITLVGLGVGAAVLVRDTLAAITCDSAVRKGIDGLGARLSLGKLDPNHDIARAARYAQLNASLHCLQRAERAAVDAAIAADPARGAVQRGADPAIAASYGKAMRSLTKEATRVRGAGAEAFAALPKGGYASVESAVADLLATETGASRRDSAELMDAALAEAMTAGGWKSESKILREAFTDKDDGFAPAFAASVGAALKDDAFDAFYRIYMVLKAEATQETLAELLRRYQSLASFAADRHAAAVLVAGGEKLLARVEGLVKEISAQFVWMAGKLDRVPQETADKVIEALGPDVVGRLYRAGVRDGALVEIARRVRRDIDDPDAALRELKGVVENWVAEREANARGTNLGDFVEDVLSRMAAKSADGDFDSAARIAEQAFETWKRDEDDRRARAMAEGIRILEAGVQQDRLRRNPSAAADKIVDLARLAGNGSSDLFAEIRRRQYEIYVAGRDRGVKIDLEISVEAARRCMAFASDTEMRGAAFDDLGIALHTLGTRGDDAALTEAVVAYRLALEEWSRERVPLDWAATQNNLGNALSTLGERGDDAALTEAVGAYLLALEELTRERVPLQWAMTQNNLGNALRTLGERGDDAALREAVAAFRLALEELTRERVPLQWAGTQNNLGNALQMLGERGDDAALTEAVGAYRLALEERTRERVPFDWAMTQNNLGIALQSLGARGDDAALQEAVAAYCLALEERTRERVPLDWAMTQNNLGSALQTLGERGDDAALTEAVGAYRLALEEWTRERVPLQWAMTQNNLGIALQSLGARGDDAALTKAVGVYRLTMEELTRERFPHQWATTQNNLGNALQMLGERGDDAALTEAVGAYRLALEERTRERVPLQWAMTVANLVPVLEVQAGRIADRTAARSAYVSLLTDLDSAIEEFRRAKSTFYVEHAERTRARIAAKAAGQAP